MIEAVGLLLPALSWAIAFTTVPSGSGVGGVKLQSPLASATVWPIGLPSPSVSTMVSPAPAVPEMMLPLLASSSGASG
ncbi:hypothetical protein D3C81_1034360 [compost metagenome]